ncbi:MAG TPA: metallophosphoesterase [Vicinamibacterales bacterium]|nr:metallophosphoesterase [Vicinamibacterales bacterium]
MRAPLIAALLWCAAAALPSAVPQQPPVHQGTAPCDLTTTARIVAIGDVHGALDRFRALLRETGVIDGRDRWVGGTTILVQTGDVLDRGPDSRRVVDLLMRLERDAQRAGGRVHALLGNHEVMRMVGDLRDVSPAEYAAFRDSQSRQRLDGLYEFVLTQRREQAAAGQEPFDEGEFRNAFYRDNAVGLVELVRAFGATGHYGRWLRRREVMVRINGDVFVHGGISGEVAALGCQGVASAVRHELASGPVLAPAPLPLLSGAEGPLWYRALANDTLDTPAVDAILDTFGARRVIVGHTVTRTRRITALHGGRVIALDTGMLGDPFYPGGVAAALVISGGTYTAVYEGRTEPLDVR